jgi:hypothetical protein
VRILYQEKDKETLLGLYEAKFGTKENWKRNELAEYEAVECFLKYSETSELIDNEKSFIVPSCRINKYGHDSEIDILVYLHFKNEATRSYPNLKNFLILVEVKSHRINNDGLEINSHEIYIKYPLKPKTAIISKLKNVSSLFSTYIKNHLITKNRSNLFIKHLVFFPNINSKEYKIDPSFGIFHKIVFKDNINDDDIIEKCSNQILYAPLQEKTPSSLFYTGQESIQITNEILLQIENGLKMHEIVTTPRDRRTLDLLHDDNQKYKTTINNALEDDINTIVLRGRSGTGKTLALLKMGFELMERNYKIIVLTFNHALKSDLQRIEKIYLNHTDSNTSFEKGILKILNIDGFIAELYSKVVIEKLNEFSDPQQLLLTRIKKLNESIDVFGTKEVRSAGNFHWDYILIDEGQDIKGEALQLLEKLRPAQCKIISVISSDQVLNPSQKDTIDFEQIFDEFKPIECKINYRNYSGIREFSYKVFKNYNVGSSKLDQESKNGDPGAINEAGTIELIPDIEIHSKNFAYALTDEIRDFNCQNNDILVIEPSDNFLVKNGVKCYKNSLKEYNLNCLDLKDVEIRKDLEKQLEFQQDIRIVDYESARGLESWIVIVRLPDLQYEHKKNSPLEHDDRYSTLVSIACSRAIKKLIITYSDENNPWIQKLFYFKEQISKKGKLAA